MTKVATVELKATEEAAGTLMIMRGKLLLLKDMVSRLCNVKCKNIW